MSPMLFAVLTAVAVALLLLGLLSGSSSLSQISRPSLAKLLRDGPGDAAGLPGGGRVIESLQVGGVHFAIVETLSGPYSYYWLYALNPKRGWWLVEFDQLYFKDPEESWAGFMGRAPFAKSRDFLVEKVIPSVFDPKSRYHLPLYAPHEIASLYS